MILHPETEIPIVSLQRLREDADWLGQFLSQQRIAVAQGSPLALALAAARAVADWQNQRQALVSQVRAPEALAQALGLSFLVRALTAAQSRPDFVNLLRLVKYVADKKASPIMTAAAKPDQERNFVFELETAALFMASAVRTETATEPDVILDDHGEIWNLACKMVYSKNGVTLGDRIEEGISQVLCHPGDYGLVVLGLANRIDHGLMLPLIDDTNDEWGAFPTFEAAREALAVQLAEVHKTILEQAATRFSKGAETTAFRGVAYVAHAVCGLRAVPSLLTAVGFLARHELVGTAQIIGPEETLMRRFHRTSQDIFAG